ncbi:MAG: hypothetical protein ABUK15_07390 [Anaerolineales bacterium]
MARTKTPFPHAAFSFGLDRLTTGEVWFVDSGASNATNGNLGDSPDRPFATLNGAINSATASNGDQIVLMPGHTETVSSALTQVISKAGLTIIGVGVGSNRPTFNFTATASSFEIDSANTTIENVRFVAGISAVVVGVNVDADNVTLKNCEWNLSATGFDFVIMVDVDTVNNCSIEDCIFRAEGATAGAAEAIRLDTANFARVLRNEMYGDFSAAAILAEGAASLQIYVADNVVYNDDTASTNNGIDLSVACTGVTAFNRLTGLQGTNVVALLDPGSCLNIENYGCNAIDELGIVIGGTPST